MSETALTSADIPTNQHQVDLDGSPDEMISQSLSHLENNTFTHQTPQNTVPDPQRRYTHKNT